jgi:hypothetical protein
VALVIINILEVCIASIIIEACCEEIPWAIVFLRSILWLLVTANNPNSSIVVTLMMETIRYFETSVLTRVTWHNIPEDGIIQHGYLQTKSTPYHLPFDVFTAVTMKNAISWDVMPCGSCDTNNMVLGHILPLRRQLLH